VFLSNELDAGFGYVLMNDNSREDHLKLLEDTLCLLPKPHTYSVRV